MGSPSAAVEQLVQPPNAPGMVFFLLDPEPLASAINWVSLAREASLSVLDRTVYIDLPRGYMGAFAPSVVQALPNASCGVHAPRRARMLNKVRSGVERTMRDHFPLGCNVTVCYRGERKELTPHGPYFGPLC